MHLFHDIRAELERLKALLEYARSEGLVDRNVASAVKLPKVSYDQGLALLERDWPILGLLPAWVSPDCQARHLHRLAASRSCLASTRRRRLKERRHSDSVEAPSGFQDEE